MHEGQIMFDKELTAAFGEETLANLAALSDMDNVEVKAFVEDLEFGPRARVLVAIVPRCDITLDGGKDNG